MPIAATLLLIGAGLVILGSVLNWFSLGGYHVNGFTTGDNDDVNDGPFFTFFAVVFIGFAITFFAARRVFVLAILSVVFAGFVILPALSDLSDINDLKDVFGDSISIGPGLPVVIVGGCVCLAGGIVALAKRRR